ncbi:MAG: hypothetical protein IOD12_17435 [Silvanigrellales bacterium]|nr:hypothetical protein [Silvanigrellales bacterium]
MKPDIEGKRAYLTLVVPDYRKASSKAEKSMILDQVVRQLDIERKSAIRLLAHEDPANLQKGRKKVGRARYSPGTKAWLVKLWHQMTRMNSKKMREALTAWLPHYVEEEIPLFLKAELLRISRVPSSCHLSADYRTEMA